MGGGRWALLILRKKYTCFYALLISEVVFTFQVRVSVMCTPRNLVLLTASFAELSMSSRLLLGQFFLKYMMISFVFSTLLHHYYFSFN